MGEKISALLVHSEDEPLKTLKAALENQSIEISRATDCREALCFLEGSNPPQLVFTDTMLPDGNWADILFLASNAPRPPSVIVVSRFVDIKAYIDAIECGAFDYIVPPFASLGLAHVVRCAAWNASIRRNALAPAA